MARDELRRSLGVTAAPRLTHVVRWARAMPQYHLGHPERVARIEARVASLPWLALAGNAYRGVGVPDCIASGERAAALVLGRLARENAREESNAASAAST
jgi:oxygen-dependent protoporphyrinogen oxidase